MENYYLDENWQTVKPPKTSEIMRFQRVMLLLLTIIISAVLFWAVALNVEVKELKKNTTTIR